MSRIAVAVSALLAVVSIAAELSAQVSPACRTYSSDETRTGAGGSQTCHYDTSTNAFTCTLTYPTFKVVIVNRYQSVADFVDEVSVIPPIARYVSGTTTYQPSGPGMKNGKWTYSYDSQRRQTRTVTAFADGTSTTATYSAWDTAGRPTLSTVTQTGAPAFTIAYAYDDATRLMTITPARGGVQTHTFDANGNIVLATAPGSRTTTRITATEKVCR